MCHRFIFQRDFYLTYILFSFFSVHVVFGHVVSGQELVRQIEDLPVDRNSRPLQDVVVANCGELIKQIKSKLGKICHMVYYPVVLNFMIYI